MSKCIKTTGAQQDTIEKQEETIKAKDKVIKAQEEEIEHLDEKADTYSFTSVLTTILTVLLLL